MTAKAHTSLLLVLAVCAFSAGLAAGFAVPASSFLLDDPFFGSQTVETLRGIVVENSFSAQTALVLLASPYAAGEKLFARISYSPSARIIGVPLRSREGMYIGFGETVLENTVSRGDTILTLLPLTAKGGPLRAGSDIVLLKRP